MHFAIVDFPEPEEPMINIFSPLLISRFIFLRVGVDLVLYWKVTFLKVISGSIYGTIITRMGLSCRVTCGFCFSDRTKNACRKNLFFFF